MLARLVLLQSEKDKLPGGCFAKGGETGDSGAAVVLRAVSAGLGINLTGKLKHLDAQF